MFWKREKELIGEALGEDIAIIISHLVDGLLVFDKENKLVLINPVAEKLLGLEKDKILGKSILRLSPFPRADLLVSFLGGEIRKIFRQELEIKEGFILEVSSVPLMSEGQKIGSLVVLHDVSREKLVERMKTEFVTVAAHQLRTPASAIKWTLQMLLEEDLGKITSKQRTTIEKAAKTNEKMINLVNDLLNVAQIEEGKYLSKIILSSLEEIIEAAIRENKEKIKEKKIKFKLLKPSKPLPKVMLDVEKMKIAFKNLLDNALRYTPAGGKVAVSLQLKAKEIEVQIQDNGLGIPERQKEKVFTKFFRGANIIRVETEGTGLGLYIAKNIIEAHGGRIWFQSQEKKGSIFYFTVPVKKRFAQYLTKEFY